ncbi:MAG: FtsX-like permease family protein [Candidatus Zixiibacteriota bacterium]
MTFRDLVFISFGNLRRMKLRAILTVSGVVIAIGTFVAMLSFGAGNQKYVTEQFEKFGLFNTMQVTQIKAESTKDSLPKPVLDKKALDQLSQLPGVRLAYPFDAFNVKAAYGDSSHSVQAQALSMEALQTKFFSQFAAGSAFQNDTAKEVLVTRRFLDEFDIKQPDSAIGKKLILTVKVTSLDSGIAHVLPMDREYIKSRFSEIKFDSLLKKDYASRILKTELNQAMSRFLSAFLNNRETVCDTLIIRGVMGNTGPRERNMSPIMMPSSIARKFSSGIRTDDPTALISALTSGHLLQPGQEGDVRTYPKITLDLDPHANHKMLLDTIKTLGYQPFSFAEQFDEIRKAFFYFDLALAAIGIIALITASLGIINTLVMSVLERRKEIGVMKSLGADDRDIRFLFLAESAVIGCIGSIFGILLGWGVSRIASAIGQMIMARDGITGIDLFAMPPWLILAAMAVGISVSLVAGLYPAARAARVDPVEALRND